MMEKGYLSLNFLKYMDPIMSLIVPMALLILGGIPLPGGSVLIQESQLQSKLWSSLTSLAGPAGNLVCGIILRLILLVSGLLVTALGPYAGNMRHYRHISMGATPRAWSVLIYLQVLAAVLNLVPLPPLDGTSLIYTHMHAHTCAHTHGYTHVHTHMDTNTHVYAYRLGCCKPVPARLVLS